MTRAVGIQAGGGWEVDCEMRWPGAGERRDGRGYVLARGGLGRVPALLRSEGRDDVGNGSDGRRARGWQVGMGEREGHRDCAD